MDRIEISEHGKKSISQAEKAANRRKIDMADGAVSFDHNSRVFTLPDGTRISADDVSSEIGEDEYVTIRANDNELTLEPGNYYRLVDKNGEITTFSCGKYGLSSSSFSQHILNGTSMVNKDSSKVELLASLADNANTVGVSLFYQNDWVINTLKDYGFTPGKVSIHINGGNCGDFYLGHNDRLYTIPETQSRIEAINLTNHLEYGAPKGSVWRIDGKEYPMDENGYFNIPLDVMCEPGSMKIVDAQGNPVILHDPDA